MTYFTEEANRIKKICFSNEEQIEMAVSTKRYIETHFDQALNLDVLARLRCVSKYHLIKVFKRYYGLTPRQYVIDTRIEEAKKILQTGRSVSDTCFAIGYDSIHSFSNLFKAKTGMSPSQYRSTTFDKLKK